MILVDCFSRSAYNGSPSIHSLPQLSGSPILRGHTSWSMNIDDDGRSRTVPGSRPVHPDFGQLQAQLQQRLNQQRVRNECGMSDWRPASDCGSTGVDTQSVIPAPFSRYSAPPVAGVLIKSGSAADRVTVAFVPSSSQHAASAVPSSSSLSSAAVKPSQSLPPPPAARPQSAKSAGGSGSVLSSTVIVGHSSPTMQHVRSA